MSETRIGIGFDVHAFGSTPPILLGGVVVDTGRGVMATSDGDVACHAVTDALLGAANLGDMGMHFPSSDPRWHGADSTEMLREALRMVRAKSVSVLFVDLTVISQSVRVGPHREVIREGLASVLEIDPDRVSVKATTTDGLGALGRDEGLAAMAVVTARVDSA